MATHALVALIVAFTVAVEGIAVALTESWSSPAVAVTVVIRLVQFLFIDSCPSGWRSLTSTVPLQLQPLSLLFA